MFFSLPQAYGDNADGMGFCAFGPLLAVSLVARASPSPRLSEPMKPRESEVFIMTREQRKQMRRGVLYILFLMGLCLLLIAGLTT